MSSGETRRTAKIRNRLGLHARAAVKFVQLASKYKSEIKVIKDGTDWKVSKPVAAVI